MLLEPGESIRKYFGARLRVLRKDAGYTADSLADELGVHRNTVFGLERGDTWIGADTLERLCHALGVTPDRLFTDKEPQPSPLEALDIVRAALEDRAPRRQDQDLLDDVETVLSDPEVGIGFREMLRMQAERIRGQNSSTAKKNA